MLFSSRLVKRRTSPEVKKDRMLDAIEVRVTNEIRKSRNLELILQGLGKPSLLHATVVIFLEFFAWGLMTTPTINVSYKLGWDFWPFCITNLHHVLDR